VADRDFTTDAETENFCDVPRHIDVTINLTRERHNAERNGGHIAICCCWGKIVEFFFS
jgi:hypothetical protein